MKILCVLPEYPPHAGGGMLLYYRTLLPELARLGHKVQVVVAAPFSPGFPAYVRDGVWDVFNLAAVEALAFERVVVVSSGAGVSELMTDRSDGFVCPAGDPTALAAALQRVAALGEAERRAVGRRARARVERELDPGRIARMRAEAYAQAVERRGGTPRASVGEWVRDAVRPGPGGNGAPSFLDHVALRDLAAHAATRVLGRVRRGMASLIIPRRRSS